MNPHDSADIEELTVAVCSASDPTDALAALTDALTAAGDARGPYLREQCVLRSMDRKAGAGGNSLAKLRALYPSKHGAWLATMEGVGAIEGNLTGLPSGWWGQELPGRSAEGTYSHYDLHKLPPLPRTAIDGDLPWLRDAPGHGGDPTGTCQSEQRTTRFPRPSAP
jgi:hypothetical protein